MTSDLLIRSVMSFRCNVIISECPKFIGIFKD